jgi:predicted transcriptional regulator of viral defense system
MSQKPKKDQIIEIMKEVGALRPRDLDDYEIPRGYLYRLHENNQVIRSSRGMYMLPDADITEDHTLVEASKRVPKGVICLLSALRFHGLTTQLPFEVWMAIDNKARHPTVDYPQLRIVRFSGEALVTGIQAEQIEGIPVKIYNPAKTVADCFKYRNKIGLDVAKEALVDCRRHKVCSKDELWKYAQICRVTKIMKPYLEVIE